MMGVKPLAEATRMDTGAEAEDWLPVMELRIPQHATYHEVMST